MRGFDKYKEIRKYSDDELFEARHLFLRYVYDIAITHQDDLNVPIRYYEEILKMLEDGEEYEKCAAINEIITRRKETVELLRSIFKSDNDENE